MDASPKQLCLPLPLEPRAAWELWKWMQNASENLWDIHGDSFIDFHEEEEFLMGPGPDE